MTSFPSSHNLNLLAGLGNPGKEYSKTRHNAGYLFLDSVLAQLVGPEANQTTGFLPKNKWHGEVAQPTASVLLLKPTTFMNRSGESVQAVMAFHKIPPQSLFVAFDDLDLALGAVKVQFGRGPKGHNGLQSIYDRLGTDQFWHLRIGIDTRVGDRTIPSDKYVLQPFTDQDWPILQQSFRALRDNLTGPELLELGKDAIIA